MRRAALLIVPLMLLAACGKEPDFEERYDQTAREIEARAKAMDADIAKSDKAAAASEDLQPPAKPSNPPTSSGE